MSQFDFEKTLISYVDARFNQLQARPLNLGGVAGVNGGGGTPVGGFVGYLPQTRVAYDQSEEASLVTVVSGMSLLDNLNHIRYRIAQLEGTVSSGTTNSGTGVISVQYQGVDLPQKSKLNFDGTLQATVDANEDRINVVGVQTGGANLPDTLYDYKGTVIDPGRDNLLADHRVYLQDIPNYNEVNLTTVVPWHTPYLFAYSTSLLNWTQGTLNYVDLYDAPGRNSYINPINNSARTTGYNTRKFSHSGVDGCIPTLRREIDANDEAVWVFNEDCKLTSNFLIDSGAYTIYIVWKNDSNIGNQKVLWGTNNANWHLGKKKGGLYWYNGNKLIETRLIFPPNRFLLTTITASPTINGTGFWEICTNDRSEYYELNTEFGYPGSINIGGDPTDKFYGSVAEIIVFTDCIYESPLYNTIQYYLINKYNLYTSGRYNDNNFNYT